MKYCNAPECVDGSIFNSATRRYEPCPYCDELKKEQINEGVVDDEGKRKSLSEVLGFRRIFSNLSYNGKKVLGEYTYTHMDKEVLTSLNERLESLVVSMISNKPLQTSLMVYLGSESDIELLGYLILANAYKSGKTVSELVTPYTLRSAKQRLDDYGEMLKADVVVATFSPSLKDDVYLMDDFMKERALRGRATIFLLTNGVGLNSVIQKMCSYTERNLHQALYMGIPNMSSMDDDNKRLGRINRVIKNGNENLKVNTPLLTLEDIAPKKDGTVDLRSIPKMTSQEVFGR